MVCRDCPIRYIFGKLTAESLLIPCMVLATILLLCAGIMNGAITASPSPNKPNRDAFPLLAIDGFEDTEMKMRSAGKARVPRMADQISGLNGLARLDLHSMEQQVRSRTNISNLISSNALYPRKKGRVPDEDLIEDMQRDIKITPVSTLREVADNRPAFNIYATPKQLSADTKAELVRMLSARAS